MSAVNKPVIKVISKPETWFIDIDGVILEHLGCGASQQWITGNPMPIGETLKTLDILEAQGAHIVLMTARPEQYRSDLVYLLMKHGVIYHQLVMGVTSGRRVIVNDCTNEKPEACAAMNIVRNKGLVLNASEEPVEAQSAPKSFPPGTRCYLIEGATVYFGTVIPIDDKYPDAVRNATPDSRLFMKDDAKHGIPTLCNVDELMMKEPL